jgi:hypothetical protein
VQRVVSQLRDGLSFGGLILHWAITSYQTRYSKQADLLSCNGPEVASGRLSSFLIGLSSGSIVGFIYGVWSAARQ